MNRTIRLLVAVYILLPLAVSSVMISAISIVIGSDEQQASGISEQSVGLPTLSYYRSPTIAVMTTAAGDAEVLWHIHRTVLKVFEIYNDLYGDGSISQNVPVMTTSCAASATTEARLKTYLQTRDRVHLAAHGAYSDATGPALNIPTTTGDVKLTPRKVKAWKSLGGTCELLYMSVCYSLGSSYDHPKEALARAIKDRTNVKAVIGFAGEVDILSAMVLAANFWWLHAAGLRPHCSGGYSAGLAFDTAKEKLLDLIYFLADTTSLTVEVLVGIIAGCIFGPAAGIVSALIFELLQNAFGNALSDAAVQALYSQALVTYRNFVLYDADEYGRSEYVPSMTPVQGSGGGSGPIDTTH